MKRKIIDSKLDLYEDYDPVIEELENSFAFQLPEEADNLKRAWEHRQAGGVFVVRKSFKAKGLKNRVVDKLLHFPSADEVEEIVEERFGGGIYTVHPGSSPKILMTYELPGESKFLVSGPKPKTQKQILKEQVEEIVFQEILKSMDEDPEFAKRFLMAYVQKELGIALPTQEEEEKAKEEERFFEWLQRNPVLYDRWMEAEFKEKYGIVLPKKPTPLEEAEQALLILAQLREMSGASQDDSWQAVLKEVGMGLIDAAPHLIALIPQLGASLNGQTPANGDSVPTAEDRTRPPAVSPAPFNPASSSQHGSTSAGYDVSDLEDERLI